MNAAVLYDFGRRRLLGHPHQWRVPCDVNAELSAKILAPVAALCRPAMPRARSRDDNRRASLAWRGPARFVLDQVAHRRTDRAASAAGVGLPRRNSAAPGIPTSRKSSADPPHPTRGHPAQTCDRRSDNLAKAAAARNFRAEIQIQPRRSLAKLRVRLTTGVLVTRFYPRWVYRDEGRERGRSARLGGTAALAADRQSVD